jgi:CHASE3 domain sensor protein
MYLNPLTEDRKKLHQKIDKLHQLGWGYTKIHTHLRKNGFNIGKSRTTVDKILKKMKRKHNYISQPILDGIGNFRVEMREFR